MGVYVEDYMHGSEGHGRDAVEVITRSWTTRWFDEHNEARQLQDAYERLTLAQAQELLRSILTQIAAYRSQPQTETGERFLTNLCYTIGALVGLYPQCLDGLYDELLRLRIYSPETIYLAADAKTRAALVALCDEYKEYEARFMEMIEALVWIGDAVTQALFHRWRTQPPVADDKLSYPLLDYPLLAGWELMADGRRRDLYYPLSYALIPGDTLENASAYAGPVTVVEPFTIAQALKNSSVTCPWCGRELISLFTIDVQDVRLAFLGLGGESLRIITCNYCVRFNHIFADFDLSGGAAWSVENGTVQTVFAGREYSIEPLPERRLVLGAQRRTPYVGCTMCHMFGGSQIGGIPQWAQNPMYVVCPRCGRRMTCIGQLEPTDVNPNDSGMFVALICAQCYLAATTYDRD